MEKEQQQINITDLLQKRKYDRNKKTYASHIAFTIQQKNIATLGSYCVLTGLPKTCKSTFISALIGSAYLPSHQEIFTLKLHLTTRRKRICYFDTESAEHDFYQQINRIKNFSLTSDLPEFIDAFCTREDEPAIIKNLIIEYLNNTPECCILIIDGFLDLCYNYNDEVETRILTNWFKKITKEYNIMLIGVLHTGKGHNQDTLGHLGSNTDRWANSTLIVEKDKSKNQFILKPKFLRSAPDFDPIAIEYFNNAWCQVPYYATDEIKILKPKK